MRAEVIVGFFGYAIHIPRPDDTIMVLEIPRSIFLELKREIESKFWQSRMFLFPMGNFEKLAYKKWPLGIQPENKVKNFLTFTPDGVVITIVDYEEGEEARCMPIPYELFTKLEEKLFTEELSSQEIELRY